jgi:hypothetical protein
MLAEISLGPGQHLGQHRQNFGDECGRSGPIGVEPERPLPQAQATGETTTNPGRSEALLAAPVRATRRETLNFGRFSSTKRLERPPHAGKGPRAVFVVWRVEDPRCDPAFPPFLAPSVNGEPAGSPDFGQSSQTQTGRLRRSVSGRRRSCFARAASTRPTPYIRAPEFRRGDARHPAESFKNRLFGRSPSPPFGAKQPKQTKQ